MSAQHTPGRLTADGTVLLFARNAGGFSISGCPDAEANARRLAACWNACEGVPTEVLEAQQAGGIPWSVADQIDQRVQFDAYKEGSEEAFGAVVEQKRKAEECVSRMESTIQSQQGVIVKMRTQRDELLAALRIAEVYVPMSHKRQRTVIDAAIANATGQEGGAA